MDFARLKIQRLETADLSRKGNIDSQIIELVEFINKQVNFFTTSSCSGRITIFSESSENSKKGCQWLYTTHELASIEEVKSSIYDAPIHGTAVFKFEPFVLHVQCKSLDDAKIMHQAAVASGFRNSGITIGKNNKIITAVRSTHGLEAPLADNGIVLVPLEYVSHLVNVANSKMDENVIRIERFFSNLKSAVEHQTQDFRTQNQAGSVRKQKRMGKNGTRTMKDKGLQCSLLTCCNHGNSTCARTTADNPAKYDDSSEHMNSDKHDSKLEGADTSEKGKQTFAPVDILDDIGSSMQLLDL